MKSYHLLNQLPVLFVLTMLSCSNQESDLPPDADILHRNQDQLTEVIIYDVFTPPVASRIYAYSSLAAYEAVRFLEPGNTSITEKLRDFGSIQPPDPGKEYNFVLAASQAFFKVVHQVRVFSVDSLKAYEESLFDAFRKEVGDSVYFRSIAFGDAVAAVIMARANADGYVSTRGKSKYLGSNDEGKWRPTPPDYLDGVEWCWRDMKPLILDTSSRFRPGRPPVFSRDTGSLYYRSLKEVYDVNRNLTIEQIEIANYWDDNPMVMEHSGHLMFANKKITPGGHWMGICAIASKQSGASAVKAAQAYALTAVSLHEAFISCWDEKYHSSYIRPVTAINEMIDPSWMPLLQTPPFPDYTSGHSTITASAATVLTSIFGDNFAFNDTSDLRYIGMQRSFPSFQDAADEVSISRLYGGIHYRFSVDSGAAQGKRVGQFIVNQLIGK